jgi:hypothetical protein
MFLSDPDFVKYQNLKTQTNRKVSTSIGERQFVQKFNLKNQKKNSIDYDTFRKALITNNLDADSLAGKLAVKENQFLTKIKTLDELNQLLNPANKDLDKNEQKEQEFAFTLKDKDLDLNDSQLEKRLLENNCDNPIASFQKYLSIMLSSHLKFNSIEESEIKNRKIEDLDLNNITEHFISKKTIIDKAFSSYIKYKATVNAQEALFLERTHQELKSTLDFYIDLYWKLRKNREDQLVKNQALIDQNNDFLNAMTAVKQMKSTENLDYYLFGRN